MRESRARWWLVASVLAVALAACGGGGDDNQSAAATAGPATTAAGPTTSAAEPATTTTGDTGAQTVQIAVTGTKVQTAERRGKVPLEVTADRTDAVHLHGYDRKVDISPGKPAVLEFTADVPGVFEVELEEAGLKLVELQVS